MVEVNPEKIKNIYRALSNTKRIKILQLCENKEFTVAEISSKIKISYTLTSEYISLMERQGLLKKTKLANNSVSIKSLIHFKPNGEFEIKK